ncbi:MAG: hypothetical protein ACOY58_04520, partial [Candidatus Micrarchaeota archaeon]
SDENLRHTQGVFVARKIQKLWKGKGSYGRVWGTQGDGRRGDIMEYAFEEGTMKTRLVTYLTLALIGTGAALRAAGEADVQSMRGLEALRVVVEELPDETKKLGISQNGLRIITEAQLQQQHHIKLDDQSPVFVYIKCAVVQPYKGVIAYHLTVEARQMVTLTRDPNLQLVAATWEQSGTFVTTQQKFTQSVQEKLVGMVDKLGYAFLMANAK